MKAAERLQIRFTRSSVIVYKAVAELVELKHGDELFGAILHDVNGSGNLYGQNKIGLSGEYTEPVNLSTTNRSNRSAAFLHTALKGGNAIMIGDYILTNKWKENMKVYVVYQENGFGGSEVAEIFSSRNIAREYVINEVFGNNQAYQNKPENVLNNCADQFIHEHDVLFNWR